MVALCRHQLVHLNAAGWAGVHDRPWDDEARACLSHWAATRLPLVVTQQREGVPDDRIALGLPAPLQWQRRRLALQVPLHGVLYFDEFPRAAEITGLLPPRARGAWHTLLKTLEALGAMPRIYGSFGWQRLTRLAYVHAASDLDLRLPVTDATMADAVVSALHTPPFAAPRLDGEIVFADGSAVAWREWQLWRARRADRVLVKRLRGVAMERGDAWLVEHAAC